MQDYIIRDLDRTIKSLKFIFQNNRQTHFTLAYKKKRLIGLGWNRPNNTHVLANKFGYYGDRVHSELDCIRKIYKRPDISKITLVNLRLNRKGELMLSKPCPRCENMLGVFQIRHLYFSNSCYGFDHIEILT